MYNTLKVVIRLIVFHNILEKLSEHGWSQYRLIKENQLGNSTVQRLRFGKPINTETIDKVCELCDCQPGDIMHYEKRE